MARKGWDQLSDAYRRRLERGGITAETYGQGASLSQARGHISPAHEADISRYRRDVTRFVDRMVLYYGRDEEEVRELLDDLSRSEIEGLMATQRHAEQLYDSGLKSMAADVYVHRNRGYPDWIYYYHGAFS